MAEPKTEREDTISSPHRGHVDDGNLTNEIDVIYHNMGSTSDFYTMRQNRCGTLEGCIQRLARQVAAGCFDRIVSVSGSKNSFAVIVETALSKQQLYDKDWPL